MWYTMFINYCYVFMFLKKLREVIPELHVQRWRRIILPLTAGVVVHLRQKDLFIQVSMMKLQLPDKVTQHEIKVTTKQKDYLKSLLQIRSRKKYRTNPDSKVNAVLASLCASPCTEKEFLQRNEERSWYLAEASHSP